MAPWRRYCCSLAALTQHGWIAAHLLLDGIMRWSQVVISCGLFFLHFRLLDHYGSDGLMSQATHFSPSLSAGWIHAQAGLGCRLGAPDWPDYFRLFKCTSERKKTSHIAP